MFENPSAHQSALTAVSRTPDNDLLNKARVELSCDHTERYLTEVGYSPRLAVRGEIRDECTPAVGTLRDAGRVLEPALRPEGYRTHLPTDSGKDRL